MAFQGSPAPWRLLYAIDEPVGQWPLRAIRGRCVLRGWALLRDEPDPPRVRIRVNNSIYPVRVMSRADVREVFHRSPPYADLCGFELALQLSLGIHLLRVEFEFRPGVWRAPSTTVFFSLGLRLPPPERINYAAWAALDTAWKPLAREVFAAHLNTMLVRPNFDIFLFPGGDRNLTHASLARQIYRDFTVTDLAGGETPSVAHDPTGYRIFLRAGDQLTDDALYAFADRINMDQSLDIIYGDEDLISDALGRHSPFFKPDWSPAYLAGVNYLGRAAAYSNRLQYRDWEERGALIAAIGTDAGRVANLRRVLLHRPVDDALGLLTDAGNGIYAKATATSISSDSPRVLLVVYGGNGQSDLTAWASKSWHSRLTLVRSDSPSSKEVISAGPYMWLDHDLAAKDILVFVDHDLAPASPLWLQDLVKLLTDPLVGAVGPTLLNHASNVRHIGLTNNDGEPGPICCRNIAFAPLTPRNVLGVSRRCLATRVENFLAVDGFLCGLGPDLEGLDYCLKLAKRGWLAVHAPHVSLTMPQWRPPRPHAITWHQQTWPQACVQDPFYREDALTTRPASHLVSMKVAAL